MSSARYDIALVPTNELTECAISASKQLQTLETYFCLSTAGPYPHVSLYMALIKTEDIAQVARLLQIIATHTPALNLQAHTYYQADGYIDTEYSRTGAIVSLQKKVIKVVNPIRNGMREKDNIRMQAASGTLHANIEQFGYRDVGALYRPHLSLTRFTNDHRVNTNILPEVGVFSGKFIKIGLFEMGDNGTCIRSVADFQLDGQ